MPPKPGVCYRVCEPGVCYRVCEPGVNAPPNTASNLLVLSEHGPRQGEGGGGVHQGQNLLVVLVGIDVHRQDRPEDLLSKTKRTGDEQPITKGSLCFVKKNEIQFQQIKH